MPPRMPVLIAAISLAAAACGSTATAENPSSTDVPASEGFPVAVETVDGSVTIAARPEHVVSLSPTSTEVLFAIGAGAQVVAVDDQSNYPDEAPVTALTGFDPNLEAIAGYGADLVVLMYDPGEVVDGLEALGIPTLLLPAAETLDDAYGQIAATGAATGHLDEASALIESMQEQIAGFAASTDGGGATYFHELSPDYYTATSATFIGSLYALLGLSNIADDADPDGFGYPQLSAEHIFDEDPSLVFLADTKCCDQSAATVAERPGWDTLSAVRDGAIVELDDDIASRWGPRVVDLVEHISAAVHEQTGE
jgi:iron complex transport system substrate-binding protein